MVLERPAWPLPPGVTAFSSTREGGVSAAPFKSFNLALHVGDDPAAVAANRALLGEALPAGTAVRWLR
ncbi:laccase domain-containing protein, partial [Pseudohaliea rubra]|uniref:laccase domain-containing protein n=1 Tax=Pseudohaliea rubra TaxID=475795 RepID=UPI0005557C54